MVRYKVVVSNRAKNALKQIILHISHDSTHAAQKVKKEIISVIKSLRTMPKRYEREKYLPDDSDYRSVCRWHFKIVYKIIEKEVQVLTIFHTSRQPEKLETEI